MRSSLKNLLFALPVALCTAAHANETILPDLPNMGLFEGFRAIWRHDPDLAHPSLIAVDAFHILQAINRHPAGCYGRDAVEIRYNTTLTTVTRNGFGVEVDRETMSGTNTLVVRREFADWVEANIRQIDHNPLSGVKDTVSWLISENGCHSPEFRQLENGMALALGVTLEEADTPSAGTDDWQTFVAECADEAIGLWERENGLTSSRNGKLEHVTNCVCVDYAASVVDNGWLTDILTNRDYGAYPDLPQNVRDEYESVVGACYRDQQPPEIYARGEEFMKANGL